MKLTFEEMKDKVDNELVLDRAQSWFPQFKSFVEGHGWTVSEYISFNGDLVLERKYE
jgi:hypothetical protein